eukprot:3736991-Rhodomonas_salina.1
MTIASTAGPRTARPQRVRGGIKAKHTHSQYTLYHDGVAASLISGPVFRHHTGRRLRSQG